MTTYPFTGTIHEVTGEGIEPVVPEEKVTFMSATAVGATKAAAGRFGGQIGVSGQSVIFTRGGDVFTVAFKATPDRGWN